VNVGIGSAVGAAALALAIGTYGAHAPAAAAAQAAVQAVSPAVQPGPDGSYADLVSRVAPAVVTVRSTRAVQQTQFAPGNEDLLRRFFGREFELPMQPRRQAGLGSGVVVRPDGYILTNHHVIDGASTVRVELTDGRSFEAQIVGADQPSDLAVLKVAATNLPTMPLGDSEQARVGDVVLAIGNPLGVGQTVTSGIISGKGRMTGGGDGAFEDFIQTDAPINQGNSGGALVNLKGELIGINSQILSPVGYNIGIGFAIPSNMAGHIMDQLITKGAVRRGMLGVTVQGINADLAESLGLTSTMGAIVTDVTEGGPAGRAGIERGDVILAVNDRTVESSNDLRNHIARLDPGASASLKVWRDGREREMTTTLGELPATGARTVPSTGGEQGGRFGMGVEPLTTETARELGLTAGSGVLVRNVDPDGPAAEAGVQSGDVILEVNGTTVQSVDALRSALNDAPSDKPIRLLINRRGMHTFLTLASRG
jgi:Do/DeqQ family serine protease